ncbi:hypothetical protein BCR44DRAFT_1427319 [Catenaria anguillulae PL171]|uniref:Cyclic nucleotide-binding domain-containing protein n=1 Tax=Catenaria anguillulae PL171 TaxID=765915 RepID=A0A1Y2HX09_9FUNG|nr:hypothetical protein BCR44DRAFT_1427319 [Catenaria anguillulae PL171]
MTIARYLRIDPKTLSWSQRLTDWVIHPKSRRLRYWNFILLFSIYITVVVEPYASAFDRRDDLISALYFTDVLYLLDVLLRFHIPYVEEHVYVMDVRKITWHYLESEFWLDCAALVPIEVISPLFESEVAFWILRTNRLIRVYRIFQYFSKQEQDLHASFLLIFFKFAFLISIVCHWFTCILFIVGCPTECLPGDVIELSWPATALPFYDIRNASTVSKYLTTLYFAVYSLTSTGYGNWKPMNNPERWTIIFGLGVCNFVFGYCTGVVTSLLVNFRGIQLQYEQKVQAVRDYMMQRSFPEDLQSRIIDYYMYLWLRQGGIDAFMLLQQLPPAFNSEVMLRVNEVYLKKISIFNGASKSFMMQLSRALRPEVFLPGDLIVHAGDIGQEMYFICRGKVEVVSDDQSQVYDAMGEGSFFGEVALIKGVPRTDNIRAATHCDIRVLSKMDLADLLDRFPDMADRFFAKSEERYRMHLLRTNPDALMEYAAAQAAAEAALLAVREKGGVAMPDMVAQGASGGAQVGAIVGGESPTAKSVQNPLVIHVAPDAQKQQTLDPIEAMVNATNVVANNLANPGQMAVNLANASEKVAKDMAQAGVVVATGLVQTGAAVATGLVNTGAAVASGIATGITNPQQLATNLANAGEKVAQAVVTGFTNPSQLANQMVQPVVQGVQRMRAASSNVAGEPIYNLPPGVGLQTILRQRREMRSQSGSSIAAPGHAASYNPTDIHAMMMTSRLSHMNGSGTGTIGRAGVSNTGLGSHNVLAVGGLAPEIMHPGNATNTLGRNRNNGRRASEFGMMGGMAASRRNHHGSRGQVDPFAPARFM